MCLLYETFSLGKSPKFKDLVSEVARKISPASWEVFAIELGLEYDDVKKIKRENPKNVLVCFMEVFDAWRKKGAPPYTWETVVEVLRRDSLKERRIAKEISDKFLEI